MYQAHVPHLCSHGYHAQLNFKPYKVKLKGMNLLFAASALSTNH